MMMTIFELLCVLQFMIFTTGNSKGQDGSESPPSLMKAHSKMYPSPWDEWWGYGGRAAPEYWGDTYPDHWYMCSRGKQQSPINIEPDLLLYDGNLGHLIVNSPPVEGILQNTGNDITLTFKNDIRNQINVTGGPLSYVFRITDVKFHFGRKQRASEHQISNKSFTAEMHIMGYNSEVYSTIDEAMNGVRGLVAIAVFIEIGLESNYPLELITKRLKNIPIKGNKINIIGFTLNDLIPNTTEYMTYEGSLTIPGCQESVTWIIYNKPVYLSTDQMKLFQTIPQMRWIHTNSRSVMPLNQRVIRTNINVKQKTDICTIEQHFNYKVNEMFTS
ncbi:putative carbonic anhydrase-like protein 2 isoform X2 [Saccostrea echinata]|uniref:putative carbonic anhydrase-like protein 2 isoform X2 n=1 Tax=Saccostrea echinata TaxID=191078 RepID=UPI002A8368F6|nr:putative carbonic anhydrase-like protein 2 isoform X2 [Saccostrea echinata]